MKITGYNPYPSWLMAGLVVGGVAVGSNSAVGSNWVLTSTGSNSAAWSPVDYSDLTGTTGAAFNPPTIAFAGSGGASVAVTQAGGNGTTATVTVTAPAGAAERAASSTTPSAIGTAAVGTGTTDARGDHVHPTGAGTPSTQAFGDAAAIGTGPAAAMTNHKHAMPANGIIFPIWVQTKNSNSLNTQNPTLTLGSAPVNGNRVIVFLDLVGRGATSVTATNATFTKMVSFTSTGGSRYEVWYGVVAGGAGGTTITVNTGSSNYASICAVEITDSASGTAGNTASGNIAAAAGVWGPFNGTAGRLWAACVGADNTTNALSAFQHCPAFVFAGTGSGNGTIGYIGYVPQSGSISGQFSGASSAACAWAAADIT